jgi:hypothetical protein
VTLLATQTLANTQAQTNLRRNLDAMGKVQPELLPWVADEAIDVEWLFARDQTLSARLDNGWWSGCSVPSAAARKVMAKLEIKGAVGCFLAPPHAAHLRVALEMLRPDQAIVAVTPEMRDLAMMLHCDDFTDAILRHRLWFAAGPAWEVELGRLLQARPGLATPSQFIRTPDVEPEQIESLIAAAQRIFAEINTARTAAMSEVANSAPCNDRRRVCVVAPSQFRLWNDLMPMMQLLFDDGNELQAEIFDCDDPCNSSPLALLSAARRSGAIFTANTARTDLPSLAPDATPWITWVTGARIPSSALRGDEDHLIVPTETMRQMAVKSGWPIKQVHLGGFPVSAPRDRSQANCLGIISDTFPLETPKDLYDFSSHALLWEGIRHELGRHPLALIEPARFLAERMKRMGVADEGFPFTRFVERLILPAYQQALARLLIAAKLPVRLYGKGWETLEEFQAFAAGPIHSRVAFEQAIEQCKALVHVWPGAAAHPVDASGVTVIRPAGGDANILVAAARKAMQTNVQPSAAPSPICIGLIRSLLLGS